MSKLDIEKTEWDLSPLLASDNDPKIYEYQDNVTKVTDAFANKWKKRTDYLEKPEVLQEALDEMEAWERTPGLGFASYYFNLRASLDSTDPKIKARDSRAQEHDKVIINKLNFFWLNIAKIKTEHQCNFLDFPGLEPYRHLLERIFVSAKYRLSEAEEKILTLKSDVANSRWSQMVSDFLSRQERKVLLESGKRGMQTFEQIIGLLSSNNKSVRDEAAWTFNDILSQHVDLAEVEFNAILEDKKIDDNLRGYERPDIARHIADDMETSAVDTLVDTVAARYGISKNFYALKAKLLNLPRLEYHERNLEVGSVDKEYAYKDAVRLVGEVFHDLDPEFASILQKFQKNGQIDVYPRRGKRGGAFCAGNHSLIVPTYILLNHNNRFRDVIVLAHELGHGINNELMKQEQNALNCSTPTSTAEVASTFMEDFVSERLLNEADEETKLAIMMSQLDDSIAPIIRQVAFYKFEQEVHTEFREEGYLSKERIGIIFRKHAEAYMGPAVEQSPGSENWWLYVPHFRNYFYVYSYASGMLISKSLQNSTRKDKQFVQKVKKFLAAGTSKSPKDIFLEMGVDISDRAFWDQGLDEIEALLKRTEALAKKLGKI